ncbi:Promotilin [Lonchura striata]|uniref:Promotilin n=1 Tax=Lonchura striata TaxID=40157 RepID=A0A218UDH6_9PASE|nr:Promotilin [Lonchura striata domestica]
MVSRKVVASLLLVSLLSVLAEQTQGFMPFFTQSDFQKMQLQEKERNKAGQKKSLSSLQQLEEEDFSEQSGVDVNAAKTLQQALPVRAWLTPRQLEKYQDVLEKLLAELLQDTPDGSEEKALELLKLKDSTYEITSPVPPRKEGFPMMERKKVNMSLLDLLPGPFPTGVMVGLTLWKIPEGDPPAGLCNYPWTQTSCISKGQS